MSEAIGNRGGMKLKVNNWDECLQIGEIGETITTNNFLTVFKPILVKYLYSNRYKFELNELIQRAGIDGENALSLFKWEVKTRTQFYPDILLELSHSYGKPGWFYYTEAEIIVYLYLDKNKAIDRGFLLIMEKLRNYFTKEKLEKYSEIKAYSDNSGSMWNTTNVPIPFKDFPKNSLISIPKLRNVKGDGNQKPLIDFIEKMTNQEV